MILIKKHQNEQKNEELLGIIRIIVGSMYENIVNEEIFEKNVIFLLGDLLQFIVESEEHFYDYKFDSETFPYLVLKEYIAKPEFSSYAKQATKNTVLEIAKHDRIIDFKEEDPTPVLKKIETKRFDSPAKNRAHLKGSFSTDFQTTKMAAYSDALRTKDEKIRLTPHIRSKNRHCVSVELMNFFGISDEISFPSFFCANNENFVKQEEEINKQWAILLTKKENSKKEISSIPDIQSVKNLIFTFFGDLFKTLYSMPAPMRILTKIMYDHLYRKYGNKKTSLNVISLFVIDFWIGSTIKFDESLIETGKLGDYTNENAETIKKIIKGIVRNDYKDVNPIFHSHFNHMLSDLRLSIMNYLCELINIEVAEKKESDRKIMSYSVCLSIADIKKFLEMLKNCKDEIAEVNDKLIKRINRIDEMAEDEHIFDEKKDINTGKTYKNHQSYVLFTELSLPS